ncbi:hypothetical protein C8R43DRAFT_903102 [Mycena crocata]|nr:hypothetical protein C8R43DRAFT_903102 [Mycena crocata]
MPPSYSWSALLLERGVLILREPSSQVKFRYWASFFRAETIADILTMAIARAVEFTLAVHEEDLKKFRPPPEEVTSEEKEMVPHFFAIGHVEPPLSWGSGGGEFSGEYLRRLFDIMNRPHAGCLSSMGGAFAFLVLRYKPTLIKKFMSGPSTQVTVHIKGGTDAGDTPAWYILHDQLSEQEKSLVLGRTREGNVDYYIYPPKEWLWDSCKHYSGELNEPLFNMLETIYMEVKENRPVRRTERAFKDFFHRRRNRDAPADPLPKRSEFVEENEKLKTIFADSWFKVNLKDIVLPGTFLR